MKTYLTTCVALVISMFSYGQDTTKIYIENFTQQSVLFQLYAIGETIEMPDSEVKKLDTLIIVHQWPLTLITVMVDSNQNYIHHTYVTGLSKEIYLKKYHNKITVLEAGSNETRNNELFFFEAMQKELGNFEGFMVELPFKKETPITRLQKIKTVYQERIKFLESYAKARTISKNFEDMLKTKFYYQQYADFLQLYYNNKVFKQKTIFTKPISDFVKQLKINDNYCGISPYIDAVVAKIMVESSDNQDYSLIYTNAKQKLAGLTREYVLYKIIESAERSPHTNRLVADFLKIATNEKLKQTLLSKYGQDIEIESVKNTNNDFQKTIFVRLENEKKITWNNLIGDSDIKYVDFWASWCGACRLELPASKKLKNDYNSQSVQFIYVSIDQNVGAWVKASQKEGLLGTDSYILFNFNQSAFAKQFKINAIPRYMIIDKDGKVINADAPRPSDPKIRELFDELLKR